VTYDEAYSCVYKLEGDLHLNQYGRGETSEEYIWMDRSVDELLECERDEVQKMLGGIQTGEGEG